MADTKKNISLNIAKYRKALQLSQQELADKIGAKNFTTVSSWERNANYPDMKMLIKLCDVFHVSLDEMCGFSVEKNVRRYENFVSYLESLGYVYSTEIDEILDSYEQDETNDEGIVVGHSTVIENATYTSTLSKDGITAEFTQEEFEVLQNRSKDTIEGMILLQCQKNKKEPPSASTENGSKVGNHDNK